MNESCQMCLEKTFAVVDGKTKMGGWAFMCNDCHRKYGVGFGLGRGQPLAAPIYMNNQEWNLKEDP